MSIAVVGSLNLDLLVEVERLPQPGETAIGSAASSAPGGKGANQAAAAAALAPDVAMVGRVGDDATGTLLRSDLAERGVDVSLVRPTPGVISGTATVALDPSGENLIVVAPGANAAVTPTDIDVAAVRDAQVVLLQLEIPLDAVTAAVEVAGGLVVLNPAPPTPLPAAVLARVDVLVPNQWELFRLAGASASAVSDEELAELARHVTTRDVVVTLGERGALVVPSAGEPTLLPAPSVSAVDATGAGDCFCAALGVALSRGASLIDAARYATAAGSLSVTAVGARGALPTDADVRAALA